MRSGSRVIPRVRAGRQGPTPDRRQTTAVLVGLAAGVTVLLLAPGVLAWGSVPAGVLVWRRTARLEAGAARRRREAMERDLPHVVDLLAAQVATGASPDRALAAVCDVLPDGTSAELRPWVGRLLLGGDPVAVWSDLTRHPQLGRLGSALHRASVSGAPVADALRRLSEDLRTRQRAEVHRKLRQVEVRAAAPLGACLLPAFVLVGIVPLVAGAATNLAWG